MFINLRLMDLTERHAFIHIEVLVRLSDTLKFNRAGSKQVLSDRLRERQDVNRQTMYQGTCGDRRARLSLSLPLDGQIRIQQLPPQLSETQQIQFIFGRSEINSMETFMFGSRRKYYQLKVLFSYLPCMFYKQKPDFIFSSQEKIGSPPVQIHGAVLNPLD